MSENSNAVEGASKLSDNMSIEALIAQRIEQHSAPEETEQEEPQNEDEEESESEFESEEAEELTEESEETEEESEEAEQEEIDLLSLSPEQIQQLAKKGKSRLLQRIGELTAKNKALEESAKAEAKPLPKSIPAAENPFSNIQTFDGVKAKYEEMEKVAEDTDRILEDYEGYGADDIITLGDKEFTKKEIRTANRNARQAMLKFLPAQAAELQRAEARKGMEEQYNAAIPVEIPELADAESPLAKQYQSVIADPLIEQVRQAVPELAPQLSYILAHAVRSMNLKKPLKSSATTPGITTKVKVPSSPVGVGAARSGGGNGKEIQKKAAQRFEESGSDEALVASLIARRLHR